MAPGSLISLLHLEEHENLVISSDDLCEFYYTFQVSKERAARNAIGIVFDSSEVCHSKGTNCTSVWERWQWVTGLAVEIAQQSHYNLVAAISRLFADW